MPGITFLLNNCFYSFIFGLAKLDIFETGRYFLFFPDNVPVQVSKNLFFLRSLPLIWSIERLDWKALRMIYNIWR